MSADYQYEGEEIQVLDRESVDQGILDRSAENTDNSRVNNALDYYSSLLQPHEYDVLRAICDQPIDSFKLLQRSSRAIAHQLRTKLIVVNSQNTMGFRDRIYINVKTERTSNNKLLTYFGFELDRAHEF